MKKDNTEYLGDGLYAKYDGYQFCLMANDHNNPTDTVYLDPKTLDSFIEFVEKVTNKLS